MFLTSSYLTLLELGIHGDVLSPDILSQSNLLAPAVAICLNSLMISLRWWGPIERMSTNEPRRQTLLRRGRFISIFWGILTKSKFLKSPQMLWRTILSLTVRFLFLMMSQRTPVKTEQSFEKTISRGLKKEVMSRRQQNIIQQNTW